MYVRTVDTSMRLRADMPPPDTQSIEDVEAHPIAEQDPPMRQVHPEPYLLTPQLCEAVNVAITLGRPLLLQGDPGVGKTRLAHAVAYRLGLPLEQAHIKSTSRGRDLLYVFDAVRRLSDAQLGGVGGVPLPDQAAYVRFGALGRAIVRASYGRRSVLLIDEIDKADLDFPNDLLRELDELRFDIDEVPGARHQVPPDRADLRPVIIVTNNEEKQLPGAFLRRCVFHFVEFPDGSLDAILRMHGIRSQRLRHNAIEVVRRLRGMGLNRAPGLSELLDWADCLQADDADPAGLHTLPNGGALIKQRDDQLKARERLSAP
ncbi:MoxR family ATPase [Dactylosporangium sp. NPDC049742]|uniref:AAA family ATPase n=1 Tax=Dactylosporangium sp. NPDC049742 TaxID=3154737 RepID=UPI003435181E